MGEFRRQILTKSDTYVRIQNCVPEALLSQYVLTLADFDLHKIHSDWHRLEYDCVTYMLRKSRCCEPEEAMPFASIEVN